MHNYLAIDAGGTSTRAVLLDSSGHCFGYGTAGGGNPVSRGFPAALEALWQASSNALGGTPRIISQALLAMAGASMELPTHLFRERFMTLGLTGNVMIESDLLAAFYSGTHHDDGCALIAGTGAVGARIAHAQLLAVADGMGWLLGDNGSGFWLGQQVARAVAAALDGRGHPTALTELLLAELEIPFDAAQRSHGRLRAQQQLILKTYQLSPVELSRFAPLVFAAGEDTVAGEIVDQAARHLAQTLLAVAGGPVDGPLGGAEAGAGGLARTTGELVNQPLIFGGSVLTKGGRVAAAVMEQLAAAGSGTAAGPAMSEGAAAASRPVLVDDGVVGAAVLVLKRNGVTVDAATFARIQNSLATLRQ
ncbi:N-acetylglucosamine kinase [Arthrobacter sp. BF1]|uniref:N-acetylglucosamine kinase n=1 Tax=Arthrobacter sp. BF1 TaxID=2821145 RepID=UPI001C4EB186|nr:BadF/BadG/BcrA/BcrD ATPase family protein [Arthrobacter sp. BF1]